LDLTVGTALRKTGVFLSLMDVLDLLWNLLMTLAARSIRSVACVRSARMLSMEQMMSNDITQMTLRDIMKFVCENYGVGFPLQAMSEITHGLADSHSIPQHAMEWRHVANKLDEVRANRWIETVDEGVPCTIDD